MSLLTSLKQGLNNLYEDQKARLTNVKDTVAISASKVLNTLTFNQLSDKLPLAEKKIYAQNDSAYAKTFEWVANNPVSAAAVAGTVANPTIALNLAKSTWQSLPTYAKVGASAGAPYVAGKVIKDPVKSIKAVENVSPERISEFYGDITQFAENPTKENAKNIYENNPVLSWGSAIVLGGAAAGAIGKTGAVIYSNYANRAAINDNTKALQNIGSGEGLPLTVPSPIPNDSTPKNQTEKGKPNEVLIPSATDTQVAPIGTAVQKTATSKKRKARVKLPQQNRVNVRVNNIIADKFIY